MSHSLSIDRSKAIDMHMGYYTAPKCYLHPVNKHQIGASESAAVSQRHNISDVDSKLIEIALNPVPSFDEGYATEFSEWKL